MDATPLDGDAIRGLLAEVVDRLPPVGVQHVVVMVGGSLLAWHGLRDTTTDVDSTRRLDEELVTAVAEVAAAHDLDPTWLNAGAARFTPATLEIDDCDRLLETPRLRVLGAAAPTRVRDEVEQGPPQPPGRPRRSLPTHRLRHRG